MADESQYASATEPTSLSKRKYDDQMTSSNRRSGFSSPGSAQATSFTGTTATEDAIQQAKKKAQEIAARLLSGASPAAGVDKRPRVETGAGGFDTSGLAAISASYGSYSAGTSKKIDIPNGRVGVIIGKSGETIKYLQLQSGARIQVTRDIDADPMSLTRMVELIGTSEQIAKAEQLIQDVLAEAEAGGTGTTTRRIGGESGIEHVVHMVPNNKVGLVIGKGGETIKNIQIQTGARVQVVPLHLPPGDTSTERSVHIDGTPEQIEAAKKLVSEVIGENRGRTTSIAGSVPSQSYQTQQPAAYMPPDSNTTQQSGYGYAQPGTYQQAYMPPPIYPGFPPMQGAAGYVSNWDQSYMPPGQQGGQGLDYYNQPSVPQQPPTTTTAVSSSENPAYNQAQVSTYPPQVYTQDGYPMYAPPPPAYVQPPPYDQQGYASAQNLGAQEGQTSSQGTQGDSTQPAATTQQGYSATQPPGPVTNFPPPGVPIQASFPMPPPMQQSFGGQMPSQPPYAPPPYGMPQPPKCPANPPVYGQGTPAPNFPGSSYGQTAPLQAGFSPNPTTSQAKQEPSPQNPPSFSAPGYPGPPPYMAPINAQPNFPGGPPPFNPSYPGSHTQPPAFPSDSNKNNPHAAAYDSSQAQPVVQPNGGGNASQT